MIPRLLSRFFYVSQIPFLIESQISICFYKLKSFGPVEVRSENKCTGNFHLPCLTKGFFFYFFQYLPTSVVSEFIRSTEEDPSPTIKGKGVGTKEGSPVRFCLFKKCIRRFS